MIRLRDILISGLLLLPSFAIAQVPFQEQPQEQLIERIVETTESDFDYDTYLEHLEILREQPLNLNAATEEDLQALGLLNAIQIQSFLKYRRYMGDLASIYELQGVPDFDLETISFILPYVTVKVGEESRPLRLKYALKYGRHKIYLRTYSALEKPKGYIPDTANPDATRYLGSRERIYARYHFTYGQRISAGITAEKDPGEEFFTGTQKRGFDYYSAHLFLQGLGKIKHLALGDFGVNLGQGLTAWTGFGTGKPFNPLDVKRNSYALSKYSSVNENRFLRGAGVTMEFGRIEVTAFGSHKMVDATIAEIDTFDQEVQAVSSLQESGYHRTLTELANRKSVGETIAGGAVKYKGRHIDVGIHGLTQHYSADLVPQDQPYNKYRFRGNQLTNVGIDYTINYRNALIYGETAMSDNGALATLNGLMYNLEEGTAISLVYRNYAKDYQTLYANSFSEGSRPENEKGVYFGISTSPLQRVTISGYMDIYRFPWLTFSADGPSQGSEYLATIEYTPSFRTNVEVRLRHETKWKNAPNNETNIDYLVPTQKTNVRLQLDHNVSYNLRLRNRIEAVWYRDGVSDKPSIGTMIYQDIKYRFNRIPVTLYGRYALFTTDDYNSRIYAYENDVLYAFSIPAYFDTGARWYLLVNWEPSKNIEFWVRLAQFKYPYATTISSGLSEIDGNKKTELTAQVRLRF